MKGTKRSAKPAAPAPARRARRGRALAVLALAAAALGAAYAWLRPAVSQWRLRRLLPRCNVILLTLDTLRADHLSCYDPRFVPTPNLDRLAAEGARFETCISQTPLTLPAHVTILSGTYPLFHQVRDNGGFLVPEKLELVSETLQRRGFATSAFIAAYVLHSKWGINQGFSRFADDFDVAGRASMSLSKVQKRADQVLEEAKDWLRANGGKRFFSWIHLYDPHAPYEPPPPFRERFPGHPYRGEVAFLDDELGKFFDFLRREGLWDDTVIVVTGDHGESFGEHREQGHGFFVYESTVRVPLIVRAPLPFPARRVGGIVEHADVAPTILDMLGVAAPAQTQGRSLLGLLLGRRAPGFDRAYTETWYPRLHFGWSELSALYDGSWKYVRAPRAELYDRAADGGEADNLLRRRPLDAARLARALSGFMDERGRAALAPPGAGRLDRDALERLAALGYVTSRADTAGRTDLLDPKDRIDLYNRLDAAKRLMAGEKLEEATAMMEAVVAADPEMVDAHMLLGNLLFRQRRFRPALAAFRRVLERRPDYNFAMLNVLYSLRQLGEHRQCLEEIGRFRTLFPDDPALYYEEGEVLAGLRRFAPAMAALEKSLALDRANARALKKMGEIRFLQGDYAGAAELIRRGIAISPAQQKSHFDLAVIAEARGDAPGAEAEYRRELEMHPRNFMASYNLAELLRRAGRADEALALYEATIASQPLFSIPYFMAAKQRLDRRSGLERAVELCRAGIALKPVDKYTAFGYYVLADIYGLQGRRDAADACVRRAREVLAVVDKARAVVGTP